MVFNKGKKKRLRGAKEARRDGGDGQEEDEWQAEEGGA